MSTAMRQVEELKSPETLVILGSAYLFERDGQSALEAFDACLEIAPDDIRCGGGRAQALFALGDYSTAAAEFRRLAAKAATEKGRSVLLDQAGLSAWLAADLKSAETDYRAALHADPTAHLSQLGLGRVLGQQGRYTEALRLFDSASDSPSTKMRSVASLWAALALIELGEDDLARERRKSIEEGELSVHEVRILREVIEPELVART